MAHRFKSGDKVRVVKSVDPRYDWTIGQEATILSIGLFGPEGQRSRDAYVAEMPNGQWVGALDEELEPVHG